MHRSCLRLFFVAVLLLFSWGGKALASAYGIEASFVHNNTSQQANEVASNTLRVKNFTGTTVSFHVNFSLPGGWQFLGNAEKDIELNAGDSIFVPVRLIINKDAKGGTSYIVTAWLSSDKGVQFASQNWYVGVPVKSSWSAFLPVKQQYFITGIDSSGFRLQLKNQGNADEQIRITLVPDRRIEIVRQSDGGAALLSFTVSLPVGTDTTITFPVQKKINQKNYGKKDADLHVAPSKESYSVQVVAKSLSNSSSWSGTMQFNKLANSGQLNDFGHSSVPLTLEANVYDVLSDGTTMSLDAYGSMSPRENTFLNYRFQTTFITNFLEQNSFLGNNHYIGYFTKNASVELGEVNGWGRSLLSGKGIKTSYTLGRNTVGIMYARAPGFFNNGTSMGAGAYHNYHTDKFSWSSYYSMHNNSQLHIQNNLYNTVLSYKLNAHHQFLIGGGASFEKYITDTLKVNAPGYGYDASYSGTYSSRLGASAAYSGGTGNYLLARGIKMMSGRVSYNPDLRRSFTFSAQSFTQLPDFFVNGILTRGGYIRADRYELRYGIQTTAANVFIKPLYEYQENLSIRVATKGIGVEYNLRNLPGVRVSTTGYMGYAKALDYALPDFFMARMSVFARWEKMFLSMRYYFGPNQLTEQVRFINDKINPQSVHMVGSYDMWMSNGKVLLSTTGNLLYESYFKKVNFRLRPELYYFARSGLRLSVYGSFTTSKQGANPLLEERPGKEEYEPVANSEFSMGFGIRKQFGIPIPGGKKFITANVVIYKDLNGNHKMDSNEEGVGDMLVNILAKRTFTEGEDSTSVNRTHGEDFITSEKGEVIYQNIPPGMYSIKCTSLVSQGEWFDANNGEYLLDKKKTVYIALTKGVRLTGSLMVERDKYSDQETEIDLSRIRVTAIDSSGKTFSALTDRNGSFLMYLPGGIYNVTINEAALGGNFIILQNKLNVDLSSFTENFSVTFNATEKKRKMNIKKFNVQGEEVK